MASIGPLFKFLAGTRQQDFVAEQIWPFIKDLMIMSSQLLWPDFNYDEVINLIEIV